MATGIDADNAGQTSYDPTNHFIPFTPAQFNGTLWDLNPGASAPWDEIGSEATHPNGNNGGPVHWTMRRWVANKITNVTPLALRWHIRKGALSSGNGVTGGIYINDFSQVGGLLVIPWTA